MAEWPSIVLREHSSIRTFASPSFPCGTWKHDPPPFPLNLDGHYGNSLLSQPWQTPQNKSIEHTKKRSEELDFESFGLNLQAKINRNRCFFRRCDRSWKDGGTNVEWFIFGRRVRSCFDQLVPVLLQFRKWLSDTGCANTPFQIIFIVLNGKYNIAKKKKNEMQKWDIQKRKWSFNRRCGFL